MLQSASSLEDPGHAAPLPIGAGLSQVLVLVLVPVPQVFEHVP